jgi:hypothetical protein
MFRLILDLIKRIVDLILDRPTYRLILVGPRGAAKSVSAAALHEFYVHPDHREQGRILRASDTILNLAEKIKDGEANLPRTQPGHSEYFTALLENRVKVDVLTPDGGWLNETGEIDVLRCEKELRGAIVGVVLNAFAVTKPLANLAIRGLTARYLSEPRLQYTKLPDAVRAAIFVLFDIDILPETKERGHNQARYIKYEANHLIKDAYERLAAHPDVHLQLGTDGKTLHYVAAAGIPLADEETSEDLDLAFEELANAVLARHQHHRPVLEHLIETTPDILIIRSRTDLLRFATGLSANDLREAHEALVGRSRPYFYHQVLDIGNLSFALTPQSSPLPIRLRGFEKNAGENLAKALLLTVKQRRLRRIRWTVALYSTLMIGLATLAAWFGPDLLQGEFAERILAWMGFGLVATATITLVEFFRRNGSRVWNHLFPSERFNRKKLQAAQSHPEAGKKNPEAGDQHPEPALEETQTVKQSRAEPKQDAVGNGQPGKVAR